MTYRYDLSFAIEEASVYANSVAGPFAPAHLDVSPDGLNWTTVASGYNDRPSLSPIDVSDILRGSDTAFVRGSISAGAQFLRTTGNADGWHKVPHVYEFRAEGADPVPEPSALIVWTLLGALGIAVGWWRRR